MPYSAFLRALSRNKALASAGGFLLGRAAIGGNLFAQLASLWTIGQYQDAKADKARAAARLAAVQTGKTDPACADPNSPECIDHAKAAAVQAGVNAMRDDRRLSRPVAWLLAFAVFCGMLVIFKIHG
ncbi:MAG TPA: hypothetical protein VL048_05915 [Xanthobacteraceae bacterium]|nr:hypothetical protein [Xanthobacteraceae bacterium]